MCKALAFVCVCALILGVAAPGSAQEPDPSMLGWWKLDEGQGGVAIDSSGRANHGIIYRLNAGLGPGGSVWDSDAERGTFLSFNGNDTTGAYVEAGRIPAMTLENGFTWAFWANQEGDGTGVNQTILGNRNGGTQAPLQFIKFTPTRFEYYNGDHNGTIDYDDLPAGEWVHLAVVKDGAELTHYRNGQESMTNTTTAEIDENPFFMGGDAALATTAEIWSGRMSDVRLYERVLSADEIRALVPPKLKAYEPDPADGAVGVEMPLLQWAAGETAAFHDVYLGTSPELGPADLVKPRSTATVYWHVAGVDPGVTYYWRIDEIERDTVTIHIGNVWSFTAMPIIAWAPDPADGARQIAQTPTLAWTAGQSATEHHLYFGADPDAVAEGAAATDKGTLAGNQRTYVITDSLDIDATYYWRVDTKDSAGTVQTGEVWSFTTVAPGPGGAIRQWWLGVTGTDIPALTGNARYPDEPDGEELVALMEGPTDWADNYGSRLYGWLYPPTSGDYTFWLASDDNGELWLSPDEDPANAVMIAEVPGWTPSRDFDNTRGGVGDAGAQMSDPMTLQAGRVYYIEALMNEGTGGDNIAVAWQGPGVPRGVIGADSIAPIAVYPLRAFGPSPADGAVDTVQSPVLSWSAGENAQQHDVYFGDDADAVANADPATAEIYRGSQAGTAYNPGALEWGKSYYWRIDEKEADGTIRTGAVWSFTTAVFVLIDDFESYTNEVGWRIFEVWVDGIGFSQPDPGNPGNGSNAAVGHDIWSTDSPHYNGLIMETGLVHGGDQSMPVYYDNANTPHYSEIERTWQTPQDWTVNGLDALVFYLKGSLGNAAEALYIVVEDSAARAATVRRPDPDVATSLWWAEVKIALSEFADAGVNLAAVKKLIIGLGDRDAPVTGGGGLIYIDDAKLVLPPGVE